MSSYGVHPDPDRSKLAAHIALPRRSCKKCRHDWRLGNYHPLTCFRCNGVNIMFRLEHGVPLTK